MANLRDLAKRVKEYLTPKPLVSAQPWNTAGKQTPLQQFRQKTLKWAQPAAQKYQQFASTPIAKTSAPVRLVAGAIEGLEPVRRYGQEVALYPQTLTQMGLQQMANNPKAPQFIRNANIKLADSIYNQRKNLGIEKPGLKTGVKVLSDTALTGMTAYGAAKLPLTLGSTALGTALGTGIGAVTGQDIPTAIGKSFVNSLTAQGLGRLTSPVIEPIVNKAAKYGGTKLMNQLAGRTAQGGLNIIEDEFYSRLNGIKPGLADQIASFGIGAIISPSANNALFNKVPLTPVEKVSVKKQLRDLKGRWAKEAGVKVKNFDYMVPSPDGRTMVAKSRLDKSVPGLMSDLEKINKYLNSREGGFMASEVRPVKDMSPAEMKAREGLTPEVKPITVYRGGKDMGGGSVSTWKSIAEDFAKNRGGKVTEYSLSPKAKIANYSDVPNVKFKDISDDALDVMPNKLNFMEGELEQEFAKASKWAKANGYDAIKLPVEGEIRVLNNKILSQSGLTPEVKPGGVSTPQNTNLENKIEFPKGYYEDPTFRNMSSKEFLEYANKNSDFRINADDVAALKAIENNENLGYFSPEQIKKDLKEVRLKNAGGGGIIKLTPEQGRYFLKLRGEFKQISKFSPEVEKLVTKAKNFNSGEDFDKFLRSWNMENTPALGGKTPKNFWLEINKSQISPEVNPLIAEARKYKSAEEFMNRGQFDATPITNTPENIKWATQLEKDINDLDFSKAIKDAPRDKKGDISVDFVDYIENKISDFNKKYGTELTFDDYQNRNIDLGIRNKLLVDKYLEDVTKFYNQAKGLTPEVTKSTIQMQDSPNLRSYNDTAGLVEQKTITKSPQLSSKSNISSPTNAFETNISLKSNSIPKPEEVAATLPSRLDNLINKTLNYSTENPTGGTREAGLWTKTLRKGQESISRKVEAGMGSDNKLVRNAATTLQNFFRGIGMSPERAKASMELRGEMSTANERAYNVMDSLYKTLGSDKKSLERINAVLDPGIAKTKVSFDQLTPTEKQVYGIIREGFDLVHDTSYANGHISADLYMKNKGKYTPRLYDVMELPAEVNKFVTQGTKKISNDLYKSRKTIDDWKIENSLNDPVYGLGKRLAQVETNTAIKKYTDFLSSNQRFISDVEKPGFTKLSDSPAYGALSGKYVLNSAAEDLKGFFFTNKATQNLYDVFRAYDRMPIRQLQKKLLTVFNPTTNVGNIVSDQVFGFVTGVDPLTLNTNLVKLKTNPSEFKQLSDYLMRQGITGTDITRTDFVNKLGSIDELAAGKKSGVIKLVTDKVQAFYGGTDDVYKVSAFKSLLDKGFSLEEATRKVADGFQNYANVGKFYDVWAKTPVVGSAFIKFQGDLMRIIKNGAVNNPLGLIGFLGTLWGVSRLSSKLSGESDSDRQYRENRFGAPMIPGLNIPLTWQTPIGEINAARYISPFFANNEITNFNKMIPGGALISMGKDLLDPEKSDKAKILAQNVNDPLLSSPAQLLLNRDFRGKQISDPNENKYQASTLTPQEKLSNQGKFLLRSYLAPPINSAIDVVSASQGKPNMYGATQTVPQSLARLGGIKISQFGSKEVQEAKKKEAEFTQYALDSIDKQIKAVRKQQLKGEITPEVAKKRIDSLEREKITSQSKTLRSFETSPEAPKDVMARIQLATQATVTNPTNALKVVQAIFTEEKMRKLSGDTLIFERETNLNMTPEKGDAVDHIIPLSLGGDNSDKNKRYISAEANQAKAKLETSLAKKLANNEITGAEARKQIKNYMEKYSAEYTPVNTDTSITSSGDVYEYLDDKGSMRTIDISEPIVYPELSGQTELDKKRISKYKGQITSRINDIVELNRLKQISDEEAEKLISELKTKTTKASGGSSKKGIKVSIPKIKFKTIKLSESKSPTPKALKLAKLRLSKANSKAYRNIKIKVASKKHAKIKLKGFKNPAVIKSSPPPVTASVFKGNIKIAKPKKIKVRSFRNTLAVSNKLL